MIALIWFLVAHMQLGYTYAPELIQGGTVSISTNAAHVAYIDGGDWQALQVGHVHGVYESGVIYRLLGADIDNDNAPVGYAIELRGSGKYKGTIEFRGHDRKICFAPKEKDLPCR